MERVPWAIGLFLTPIPFIQNEIQNNLLRKFLLMKPEKKSPNRAKTIADANTFNIDSNGLKIPFDDVDEITYQSGWIMDGANHSVRSTGKRNPAPRFSLEDVYLHDEYED